MPQRSASKSLATGLSSLRISPGSGISLHLAAEEGDLAKVKQCLKKGTNIDCVAGKASYRVLHKAVRAGDKKMVAFLIQQRANVNVWAIDGTPLDFAINNKHPEIERLLREQGGKTGKELEEKQK